jgi:hypothetical protein
VTARAGGGLASAGATDDAGSADGPETDGVLELDAASFCFCRDSSAVNRVSGAATMVPNGTGVGSAAGIGDDDDDVSDGDAELGAGETDAAAAADDKVGAASFAAAALPPLALDTVDDEDELKDVEVDADDDGNKDAEAGEEEEADDDEDEDEADGRGDVRYPARVSCTCDGSIGMLLELKARSISCQSVLPKRLIEA